MTKKTKDLKLTEKELKQVQEKVSQINNLQMQVGGLELQKNAAVIAVGHLKSELDTIQKQLEDKYGQVSVDLKTGILKDIPKNATDKKN
tara:strand:+ start:411 stop:677 length:267 start_codon:yes stop_codon:yes gene_type:complete